MLMITSSHRLCRYGNAFNIDNPTVASCRCRNRTILSFTCAFFAFCERFSSMSFCSASKRGEIRTHGTWRSQQIRCLFMHVGRACVPTRLVAVCSPISGIGKATGATGAGKNWHMDGPRASLRDNICLEDLSWSISFHDVVVISHLVREKVYEKNPLQLAHCVISSKRRRSNRHHHHHHNLQTEENHLARPQNTRQ
jgi:hypothetical protein